MKRTKIHTLVGLVLLCGAAAGCEDFLSDAALPQGQLDELTLANRGGLEGTLVGAYRRVGGTTNWGSAPSNWALFSVPSDDAYKGTESSDQPQINPIEIYQWSVDPSYPNDKWNAVYEGVQRSNAVLRLLNTITTTKPGEVPEAVARSIRGEALFLRAHYHFEAYRVFKNVPYYTDEDPPNEFRKANIPAAQVLAAILQDLDAAIGLLPDAPRNNQPGRPSVWTARAYKGRVQIYAEDFPGALTTLRQVRTEGPYALETSYDRVWTALVANGPETIWAYQASVNDGEPNGDNGNWGERLNFPHSGSPFGCCGFHQPSQNLVNFFRVDDNGLPLAISVGDLTPLTATAAWNTNNTKFVPGRAGSMAPVDPRLDWTVGRDSVPYKDWGIHLPNWIRQEEYGGPYSPKKHIHEERSGLQSTVGWNAQHLNGTNIHLFRYADLLLMLAEAEIEAGGAGGLDAARQLVNQVRTRAGQRAQGCGVPSNAARAALVVALYPQCAGDSRIAVPLDDPTITWATYRIGTYPSFPNAEYAKTAVRYERRLELAFEGQRIPDLQRWNELASVLNDYVSVERNRRPHLQAAGANPVTDRHQAFPIPPVQRERSRVGGEDRLTQNPGW